MADAVVDQKTESLLRGLDETRLILQNHNVPDETRQRMKRAAKGLLNSLEEPKDVILDYAYQVSVGPWMSIAVF